MDRSSVKPRVSQADIASPPQGSATDEEPPATAEGHRAQPRQPPGFAHKDLRHNSSLAVSVANRQTHLAICEPTLAEAVRRVLASEGIERAEISLAVVDNAEIHRLNAQFLQHDYPTDALSFVLSDADEPLEGQIVVSAQMAAQQAGRYGWQPADELLLYVIHAALHLAGHDDHEDEAEQRMRDCERLHLAAFGLDFYPDREPGNASPADPSTSGQSL